MKRAISADDEFSVINSAEALARGVRRPENEAVSVLAARGLPQDLEKFDMYQTPGRAELAPETGRPAATAAFNGIASCLDILTPTSVVDHKVHSFRPEFDSDCAEEMLFDIRRYD